MVPFRVSGLILAFACCGAADWPQFRGPSGQGLSSEPDIPIEWSETKNVAWRTAIPGEGWSSPTIVNGRVWLTTATEGGRSLRALAVEADEGSIELDIEVFALDSQPSKHQKNTHASPTPILTAERVYVHFGRHGTAALDHSGNVIWRSRRHVWADGHGNGGSPVLYDDLLIFNADGYDRQSVVALDAATGETRWVTPRDGRMSFATPLVIETDGGPQVVSPGGDQAAAYDPRSGEQIWSISYDGYSVVPRPVSGDGMTYFATGYFRPVVHAVSPEGAVVWRRSRGAPLTPSMLLVDEVLYMVSDNGIASAVDARTGVELGRKRLPGAYSASPLYAGGRIYFTNESGETTVAAAGPGFREFARNRVEGDTLASLAVSDGSIYLRTRRHLYRITDR